LTCGIYKIENKVNGKIYIGQSIEIENRWKKHLRANDDFIVHKTIHKYGKENFTFSIVEECGIDELNSKEIYWINFYQSIVPNGYNMIPGGSNGMGLSKGLKVNQYDLNGLFIATYDSANQASAAAGVDHWSICACCRGEYRHAGGYQWKYADDTKIIQPIVVRTNFTVLQIDKNTDEVICEYNSLKEASQSTGIASSTICNVCKGKGKTAGGYKWKYKE
jgi:hypothetical protein